MSERVKNPRHPESYMGAAPEESGERQTVKAVAWVWAGPEFGELKLCPSCGEATLEGFTECSDCDHAPTDDSTWRDVRAAYYNSLRTPRSPEPDALAYIVTDVDENGMYPAEQRVHATREEAEAVVEKMEDLLAEHAPSHERRFAAYALVPLTQDTEGDDRGD